MKYLFPRSVEEAVEILHSEAGGARIIAGGTDLIVEQQAGYNLARVLVDITRIEELLEIGLEGDYLTIGSGVSLTAIAESDLVKKYAPSLAKGAASVGCLQIGNMGTLVGNIITAQPAADAAMSIAAFEPLLDLVGQEGGKTITMAESYKGFARSHIDSTRDLVTRVRIPCLKKDQASEFLRLELRGTLALPMLNIGLWAQISQGRFDEIRVVMGPVGVGPTRALVLEDFLRGREASMENIEEASRLIVENANPRSNPLRGSRDYRLQTLPVLAKRGLLSMCKDLGISI